MCDIGVSTEGFEYLNGKKGSAELCQLEGDLSLLRCIQRQATTLVRSKKKLESMRSGRELTVTILLAMFFFFLVIPQVLTRFFGVEDHVLSVYVSEVGVRNTLVLVAFLFVFAAILSILAAGAKREVHREQFVHFLSHEMIDLLYGTFIQGDNAVKNDASKIEFLEYLLAMRVYLGEKTPHGEFDIRPYEYLREAKEGRAIELSEEVFREFFEIKINRAVSQFENYIGDIESSNQQDGLIHLAKEMFEGQRSA